MDKTQSNSTLTKKEFFREKHLFALLEDYTVKKLPIDLVIHHYFRSHRVLGSKDRAFLAETIYALIRWQGLLEAISKSPSWKDKYQVLKSRSIDEMRTVNDLPLHTRLSTPVYLFELLVKEYGEEKAASIALINNQQAPTTIRVNLLKTDRDTIFNRWNEIYDIKKTSFSKVGITFNKRINFFELKEFSDGCFEVQDEGSQLLADLVNAQPGQWVLDYCAGSGGKTLAFAPKMQDKGQIFIHDIRLSALQEAKKRMKRANVQNYQILLPDSAQHKKLKGKMDWVLVDAPCSGTGTFRRHPDMKWKFNEELLSRLIAEQRSIFAKALNYVKKDGYIIYATCSLLQAENENQMNYFIEHHDLSIVGEPFKTLPSAGGMDGFFAVVFKRKSI